MFVSRDSSHREHVSSTIICLYRMFCFVGSKSLIALHMKCQILLGARIFQTPFHTIAEVSKEEELGFT